jgi:hypothetical protein
MHVGFLALYGGPDQLMPLTSSLAAIFAFVLMFWGKLLVAFDKIVRFFKGTPAEPTPAPVTTSIANEESKAKE